MTTNREEKIVGALQNGLKILRYLAATPAPVGVSRIARDLNINSSTCFNLLKTLVYEDLIHFDENTKTYTSALGIVELAKGALEQKSYIRMIHPHLEEISALHRVTVTLWHLNTENRAVLVDRVDSESAIRVHMSIGQRLPAYVGAFGRMIAAYSNISTAELRSRFSDLRWDAPPKFEQYNAEVLEAREKGFAVDNSHFSVGVLTVASAILDSNRRPLMAISAVGIGAQFNPETIENLGIDLRDRTKEISTSLSGGMQRQPL
ncbi:IclR family transcriptional regulator [Vreelandella titanicae]|uniref:HTH-type transcriptional repressor AllR n=1 Tax=Vreelandella titanicae TaxID=664683 RepID=A0AAP9NQZ2_9GAMM|nr:IclR family transcriptional regulator [Halomonas titanicae]QKS26762.1 HTH-type transcriptional repressor AllR [Halomonas titanicae]